MTVDLEKKTLDKVIAEQFPEYSSKAKEIAFKVIYDNVKELPTTADIRNRVPGLLEMRLTVNKSSGAKILLGIFNLEKDKDGSLSVLKNDLEAPTNDYWELVGKFKPY